MGLIDWLTRLESPFNPRAHIYTALIQAGDNDPHNCIFLTYRGLDEPVILQNEHAFQMPDDPNFVEIDYRLMNWGERYADVHEIVPTDDPQASEHKAIELPDEATGIWYPEESEVTDEKLAQLAGEA